jgi:GNAT superfamily N-acetyltransferase
MTESTVAEDWTLERFQSGDEEAVLGLFTTVFGRSRSREHWNWQFRDNPYGGPYVSLARSARDRSLVGSYSVTPVMLNLMGRAVPGCQSVDTAVHPDWRNQRVFERTARDCYAWCQERGIVAVVGFPNARSYPGFMRTLGWRRIGFPRQYVLRLDWGRSLARAGLGPMAGLANAALRSRAAWSLSSRRLVLERQTGSGITGQVSSAVPGDYESLWAMVRSQEVLSTWKDEAYLRWRYDDHPDHTFEYLSIRHGDELLGLAVTVDLDDVRMICEFMVRGRDVAVGRLLADHVVRRAAQGHSESVQFIGRDIGFFDEAFVGFERRLSTANVYCGRSFGDATLTELLPLGDNWTITFGDGDFV